MEAKAEAEWYEQQYCKQKEVDKIRREGLQKQLQERDAELSTGKRKREEVEKELLYLKKLKKDVSQAPTNSSQTLTLPKQSLQMATVMRSHQVQNLPLRSMVQTPRIQIYYLSPEVSPVLSLVRAVCD